MHDYNYVSTASKSQSDAQYNFLVKQTLFTIDGPSLLGYGKKLFVLPDGLGILKRRFPSWMQWEQWPYELTKFIQISKDGIGVSLTGSGASLIMELRGSSDAKNAYSSFEAFKKAGKLPNSLVVRIAE